jgi:hypothetical protein
VQLPRSGFIDLAIDAAICRRADAVDRSTAARLLVGRIAPPPLAWPDLSVAREPGRVHGLGGFKDEAVHEALSAALPEDLRHCLRPDFEWYACRGAFFHHDAHYADVLFGAWCARGPFRELVFARPGLRIPAAPGDWVIFDPFEPHAVLDAGADRYRREDYVDSEASLFIGFELRLDDSTRRAFGIGQAPAHGIVLATQHAVNAETGVPG